MSKIKSLGVARAEKSQDCRDWSVIDCLRDTIAQIEAGKINPDQCVVIMLQRFPKTQTWENHWAAAGLTTRDHLALIEIHKHTVLTEVIKPGV